MGKDFKILYREIQKLRKEQQSVLNHLIKDIEKIFKDELSEDGCKIYGQCILKKYRSVFWRYVIQLVEDNNKKNICPIVRGMRYFKK